MSDASELLTPTQVSFLLGLSPSRVTQLFDAGRLTGQRTALGRLIDRGSVDRMIEQRRAASRPLAAA